MEQITVRFKADDPAILEKLRRVLVDTWLAEPSPTITVADVDNVRVTYVKEN